MIVAMSRFRVTGHREREVRQAFLDRPRLVDDQPGFLGLEVFHDPTDCAVFYLVTRWSDLAAFRTWHASPAHRRSHELMPKGLKLDSAFTELRVLERLETGQDGDTFDHFAGDWGALTRGFLASSDLLHGVVAAPDGAILGATPAMERLLGSQPGRLHGQPLWQFLIPESAGDLRGRVAAGSRAAKLCFTLTFLGAGSRKHALVCNLDVQPDAFALLCETIPAGREPVAGGGDDSQGGPPE
jgi:heme-degrading monooxygenase HmoA